MSKSKLHDKFKSSGDDSGTWAEFGDGIAVKVRMFKSPFVQAFQKTLNRPYADMVRRGPLPQNIAEDLMERLIAGAVIADWRGVTDEGGNVLKPTDENKLRIIKELPEFRDEILSLSFDGDGFRDGS